MRNLLKQLSCACIALVVLCCSADAFSQEAPEKLSHLNAIPAKSRIEKGAERAVPLGKVKPFKSDSPLASESSNSSVRRMDGSRGSAEKRLESVSLPNLRGAVIRSSAWTEDTTESGIYQIMPNGVLTSCLKGPQYGYGLSANGIYYDIYVYRIFTSAFVTYNPYNLETGEKLASFDSNMEAIPIDAAVDPSTGKIYAICFNSDGTTLNLSTMEFTEHSVSTSKIGDLPGYWCALACDANGQLYAISQTLEEETCTASQLYKIDKNTAASTLVGDTGQLPHYQTSATIDPKTNRMFWTVSPNNGTSYLCEIDLATGAATKIVDFINAEEIVGLYTVAPLAEDKAPAEPTMANAIFEGGALTGLFEFKAPVTLFDGTPADGDVDYTITIDGIPAVKGTTQYGAEVSVPITVPQSGTYTFTVFMSNENGESPKSRYSCHVGFGTPKQTTAKLEYSNGTMNVTWDSVAETIDGGYIDPETVGYKVIRYPDEAVVADGIKENSFSEQIEEPEAITLYYYTVSVVNGGMKSAPAATNKISLGFIIPPYVNDFSDQESLAPFTILNVNGDNRQWEFNGDRMSIAYNGSEAMDDWLISPAMKLEGKKAYKFSFVASNAGYDERIEAKWGSAPEAEAMTNELVAPTDINSENSCHTFGGYFVPQESGVYYVGIHGISDPDKYYLYIDDFAIENGFSGDVPAQVSDVAIVPDPNGEKAVDISFKTPDKTYGGDPLEKITSIEVIRDGSLLKKYENPDVSETISFVDNPEKEGYVTYAFAVWNEHGMSEYYSKTVFIGIDAPAAPENIRIVENGDSGEVTLTWERVTTDRNGQAINPDLITYDIAKYDPSQEGWVAFTDRMTGTSHTFQAVTKGQGFVQYAVFAHTKGGYNPGISKLTAVGTPYDEITESFPGKTASNLWATGFTELDGSWLILEDGFGIPSQDGDNGLAAMKGFNNGSTSGLISGKISLKNAENPGIRFYVYNLLDENSKEADDENEVQIFVKETGADDWIAITRPVAMNSLGKEDGWKMVSASLSDYKGKTIQIRIQATSRIYFYTYVDNIKIGDLANYDISAVCLSAPKNMNTGEKFTVSALISNVGLLDASDFSVELYDNDKLLESKDIRQLGSGKDLMLDFECMMSPIAVEPMTMYVNVKYNQDEDLQNNSTSKVETAPKYTRLPKVVDLYAKDSDNGIELTWSQPDLAATTRPNGNEDFENADSWAHMIDHWTFIDRDQSPVGGFRENGIPGITPGDTKASFFVFDNADGEFNETFGAHSGNKYLVSLFRYDEEQTDDWAISPVLDGSAQTISFWARSYSQKSPEKIEMLYSEGSLDPDDFVLVETVASVPGDVVEVAGNPQPKWNEYKFDVPAGAKYFAIRSCAAGSFMLELDDFTFKPGVAEMNLVIKGYDIYRDGELITESPVSATTYTDSDVAPGDHNYVNVTVYETGISAPSNVASVIRSGVENIESDDIRIISGTNEIIVMGASKQYVTVSEISGTIVYSAEAGDSLRIPVSAGVYVVTAGSETAKVIVK